MQTCLCTSRVYTQDRHDWTDFNWLRDSTHGDIWSRSPLDSFVRGTIASTSRNDLSVYFSDFSQIQFGQPLCHVPKGWNLFKATFLENELARWVTSGRSEILGDSVIMKANVPITSVSITGVLRWLEKGARHSLWVLSLSRSFHKSRIIRIVFPRLTDGGNVSLMRETFYASCCAV